MLLFPHQSSLLFPLSFYWSCFYKVIDNQDKVNKNKISSICSVSILLDIIEPLRADPPKFSATSLPLYICCLK